MKSALLALFLLSAATPAFAMQVEVTCFPKAYSCNAFGCGWQTIPTPMSRNLDLIRDINFPNSDFPYEVWRARMQTQYDGHLLTLNITYTSQDLLHPLNVYANLNARSVIAETSGQNQIDVSLRNANYGRGFICSNIRLLN
ncbi:MAG: hypothetical protein KF799_03310 [Bdellovibrionales bacterium]|nr:hypothetical protein [Bdellovibrionales bacterium]